MPKPEFSPNQLRDYSSVFSRNVAKSLLSGDYSAIDYKLNRYDEDWLHKKNTTYLKYIKYLYKVIEANYQNEYIFKNEFLNQWLIKNLGEPNSKVFSEYRVGNAIADLVMFNGNSKAFEIKSSLDSDKRLKLQLENYRKAFNEIYLVIPKFRLNSYRGFDRSVGIISFNYQDSKRFTLERRAELNDQICASTIMHVLRTAEYKNMVKNHYGDLPEMTSFNMFKKCFELIKQIPTADLNRLFIAQMKKRAVNNNFSTSRFCELNQLFLALNLSRKEQKRLIENLQVTI
jgi:hypothetical protein